MANEIDPFTAYRVMFQYQTSADLENFQALYQTPRGLRHLNQKLPASKNWRWHSFELANGEGGLGEPVQWLRFDFGQLAGEEFLIRDLRLIRVKPEFDPGSLEHQPFSLKETGNQATVETLAGVSMPRSIRARKRLWANCSTFAIAVCRRSMSCGGRKIWIVATTRRRRLLCGR